MSENRKEPGCLRIVVKVIVVLWLIALAAWLFLKATVWIFGPPRWG